MATDPKTFGSCCELLKEAMSDQDFDPLISVGEDDGVLYLSVGLIDVEEEEPGSVEFPIYYCPFCGTSLQTPEEVEAKSVPKAS
jgi:hypothetical protein